MWKTVAPAFQHFSISSTISSGVTGTYGVIDLVGTLPVKATVMMTGLSSAIG